MEKSKVMEIATTIRKQLMCTTDPNVLFSWGLQGFIATTFNKMDTLKFKVNGRLFKGYVLICYNTLDYYEIYLSDEKETRCICDMAYSDNFGEIIDTAIESGTDPEEYNKFCKAEGAKLFSGHF